MRAEKTNSASHVFFTKIMNISKNTERQEQKFWNRFSQYRMTDFWLTILIGYNLNSSYLWKNAKRCSVLQLLNNNVC